jgi:hypothetical protein
MPLQDLLALIAVVGVGGWILRPIAQALAERLKGARAHESATTLDAVRDEVAGELRELRREVAELHERVDFAERLLTKGSAAGVRPPEH